MINPLIESHILELLGAKIDDCVIPPKIDFWRLRKGELVELLSSKGGKNV